MRLARQGILGMNRRNIAYIGRYNPRRLFPLVDNKLTTKLLASEAGLAAPELIGGEIQKIGRLNGLSSEQLNACLSDQEYAKALVETYQTNAAADEVNSTPTFLIEGEKTDGNIPFEQLAALIEAKL